MYRLETTNCGPLLGADEWRPSILALDPQSQQLFVAETGQPRIKVWGEAGGHFGPEQKKTQPFNHSLSHERGSEQSERVSEQVSGVRERAIRRVLQ